MKAGEPLIVSDTSPNRSIRLGTVVVEKAATSVGISTPHKDPRILQDSPAMPCVRGLQQRI